MLEESKHVVEEGHSQLITTRRLTWASVFMMLLIFVLMVGLQFQVTTRNKDIRKIQGTVAQLEATAEETGHAAADAKAAAEDAQRILNQTIAQVRANSQNNVPADDIRRALEAVHRIEALLNQP